MKSTLLALSTLTILSFNGCGEFEPKPKQPEPKVIVKEKLVNTEIAVPKMLEWKEEIKPFKFSEAPTLLPDGYIKMKSSDFFTSVEINRDLRGTEKMFKFYQFQTLKLKEFAIEYNKGI